MSMSDNAIEPYKKYAFRHAVELFAWYGVPVCDLTEDQVSSWRNMRAACAQNTLRIDNAVSVRVADPSTLHRANPDLVG